MKLEKHDDGVWQWDVGKLSLVLMLDKWHFLSLGVSLVPDDDNLFFFELHVPFVTLVAFAADKEQGKGV